MQERDPQEYMDMCRGIAWNGNIVPTARNLTEFKILLVLTEEAERDLKYWELASPSKKLSYSDISVSRHFSKLAYGELTLALQASRRALFEGDQVKDLEGMALAWSYAQAAIKKVMDGIQEQKREKAPFLDLDGFTPDY